MRCFALDLAATNSSALTGISTSSAKDIFLKIRSRLAAECQCHSPLAGEVEIDESYFGQKEFEVKEDTEQDLKQSSSESFNAKVGFIPKSFQMPTKPFCRGSLEGMSN